jgi:predicted transglutaminase-like cysteine proteinase
MKAVIAASIFASLAPFGSATTLIAAPDFVIAAMNNHTQEPRGQARGEARAQQKVAVLGPTEPFRLSSATEPFGLNVVSVESGELVTKWRRVETDIRTENDILARCSDNANLCPSAAQRFLGIVAEGRAHTSRARIGVINRAINLAIRPTSDLAQWGVPHRWSGPIETLTTGRGVCVDYAIATSYR